MAVDMYIKIGDIKGESQDKGHEGEIDVLSWNWGMTQDGNLHHGGGGGSGKVDVKDINFTKYFDKASPVLMLHCCNGKHHPEAKLVVRKAGETPVEYIVVTFTDCIITGVTTGGSGNEDKLVEHVTINFREFKIEYQEQGHDGKAKGGAVSMAYNIATGEATG